MRLLTRRDGLVAEDEGVAKYRLNAEKCLKLASTFSDPESKRSLLVMANAWLILAAQHSKNSETYWLTRRQHREGHRPTTRNRVARRDEHT
jgi:hypothetical protein